MFGDPAERMRLSVVSADPLKTLKEINRQNIMLNSVEMIDALTASFEIHSSDYYKLRKLSLQKKWELRTDKRSGVLWNIAKLMKRPLLGYGLIFMLILTLYLPSKVLLVKVTGNHIVSSEMILDAASSGGIYFGASRQRIRSEMVKNILLSKIPQLQWAGINTYGCIAEISVQEKKQPVKMSARCGVTSIVAARDGVITSMHVSSGLPMCKPGQAVKSGEVLVSGYIDCGICVYGTTANGEIYADTMQRISAKIPNNYSEKVSILPLAK
jgi:sporulation protein YqfD